MKNKSLFSIVRASLMSNKALSAMFCFFVLISYVLIFLALGIIIPLGVNIETRLNRHIINREINIEMSEVVSEEEKARLRALLIFTTILILSRLKKQKGFCVRALRWILFINTLPRL